MIDLTRDTLAMIVAVAVYLILSGIERRGYKRGYKEAAHPRRPQYRPKAGYDTSIQQETHNNE